MSRTIDDLLSTKYHEETWGRLISCMRYSQGRELILACQILQNQLDFNTMDVAGLLRSVNNPEILARNPKYEEALLHVLLKNAGLSHDSFVQRKKSFEGVHEQLIADWYLKYCDQAYYDAKKPALLAIFQEQMDNRKFSHIAAIALLLRQKKWADMTVEERTVFETLYGPEGKALFNQYLKQDEHDECKNAFGEQKSLYAYPSREPLDILAGQYYVQMDKSLFTLVFELQCAYRDVIFPNESYMKFYWERSRCALSKLKEEMLQAIGPIPSDLLSEAAQKALGVTPSDLRLPQNFTENFSADLCIHYFSNIKSFIDRCRDVALIQLSKSLVFNDLECSYIMMRMVQLELIILRKQVATEYRDLLLTAKKAYDLVSLELKLAKKVLTTYPEIGRLLHGYAINNMALCINYLVDLRLDKAAFLSLFPECEQVYFWRCIFSADPMISAHLCWGLLCIARDRVTLTDVVLQEPSQGYKAEMRRGGLSFLNFFNMYRGARRDAEDLASNFDRSLVGARLKKMQHKWPDYQAHCESSSSCGGGRYPSY